MDVEYGHAEYVLNNRHANKQLVSCKTNWSLY